MTETVTETETPRVGVNEVVEHFEKLEDPSGYDMITPAARKQ